MRTSHPSTNGRSTISGHHGFTLVELLVVIGVIAVLISMLLPALNAARRRAGDLRCANNQRQLGVGISMYVSANSGWLPYNDRYASQMYVPASGHYGIRSWQGQYTGLGLLYGLRYLDSAKVFWCPAVNESLNYQETMRRHYSPVDAFGTFTNPDPASTTTYTSYKYRLGLANPPQDDSPGPPSWSIHPAQRASRVEYPDDGLVFCGGSNIVSGGNTTLNAKHVHEYRGFNLLLIDGSVHWFSFKDYPRFPETSQPQNGQAVGGANAASDSYANRYRRDMAWLTMRRAALVFHNQWRNPKSTPSFDK